MNLASIGAQCHVAIQQLTDLASSTLKKKIIFLLVIKQNTFFTLLIFLLGEREVGTEGKLLLLAKEDGFLDAVDVHNRKKVMGLFEQN